jgi:ribosomal protein S18 acetylase RimI-like enzyme
MFPSGYNSLTYNDVVSRPGGLEAWDNIISRITAIALENPHHFLSRVAKEVIPDDAKRHEVHCYLADNGEVLAFAVISIAASLAEILWLACAKRVRRQGIAGSLMQKIEEDLFSFRGIQTIKVLCCSEDTFYTEGDEQIDGSKWHGAYAFYKAQGYGLHYRLDHYWAEGSHAYVYLKRRENRYNSLLSTPKLNGLSAPSIKSDPHSEINRLIHNHIWNCLDAFDERFVNSIGVTAGNRGATEGITGIIMGSDDSNICTIFAQRCKDPIKYSDDMRFVFDMNASMLTLILKGVKSQQGVLPYLKEYDRYSEIKVAPYFSKSMKKKPFSDYFHVFFAKHKGESNSYAILYFITPNINNVDIVWCLNQWSSLAHYSFSFFLELYGFFLSFQVTERKLGALDYFQKLIRSVSPSDSPEAFEAKLIKIKNDIQNRMTRHYKAILNSKESAIRHYGHTMGHRISPILKHFDERDSESEAAKCARLVSDMSLVLQAYAVESEDAFFKLNKEKGRRFIDTSAQLDLLRLIREDVAPFADKDVDVADSADYNKKAIIHRYPQLETSLQQAYLGCCLTDPDTGVPCRPHSAFYTQLISEIIINAVQHGRHYRRDESADGLEAKVRVYMETDSIGGNPALVISNFVGFRKPIPEYFNPKWERWPEDRENNGPSMAIAFFRSLGIGDMWLSFEIVNAGYGVLRVALAFDQLYIA